MRNIDVVMATYNGEPYIEEQLQSIVDCEGFDEHINRIIISDDGSSDKTLDIARNLSISSVEIHSNNSFNGVIGNFNSAVSRSDAEYIIFSDQDDVWCENKIQLLYQGIRGTEKIKSEPCLFFTDLEVVDENLKRISPSFWKHQKLNPKVTESLSSILTQNVTPGCALIVNRALLDIAFPCPANAVMHDWWLLLCAKAFGRIRYSPITTIKYRQHGTNTIGANSANFIQNVKRVITESNEGFNQIINQVTELAQITPKDHQNYELIYSVSKIRSLPINKRTKLFSLLTHKDQPFERKITLFTRLMLLK